MGLMRGVGDLVDPCGCVAHPDGVRHIVFFCDLVSLNWCLIAAGVGMDVSFGLSLGGSQGVQGLCSFLVEISAGSAWVESSPPSIVSFIEQLCLLGSRCACVH